MSRSARGERRPRRGSPTPATTTAALDALHRRADLLLKDLRADDPARTAAAAQRIAVLPWLKPAPGVDRATHVRTHRHTIQRAHALDVVARELAFASWSALRRHLDAGEALPELADLAATATPSLPAASAADPVAAMRATALARIAAADPADVMPHTILLELDLAQQTPDDSTVDAWAQVRRALHPLPVQGIDDGTAVMTLPSGCVIRRFRVRVIVTAHDEEEALQLADLVLHGRERRILSGPAKGYACAACDPDEPFPDVDHCRQCRLPDLEDLSPHAMRRVLATHLTLALRYFFAVEIRNESDGGVSPATLESAMESWCQADDETLRQWCAPAGLWAQVPLEALPALDLRAEETHLEALRQTCGPEHPLATLLVAAGAPTAGWQLLDPRGEEIGVVATADDATRIADALTTAGRGPVTVRAMQADPAVAPVVDPPARMHGPYTILLRETNADAARQRVWDRLAGHPDVRQVLFPEPVVEATPYSAEGERPYRVSCAFLVDGAHPLTEPGRRWLAERLGIAVTAIALVAEPPCPQCGQPDTVGFLPEDDDAVGHQCGRCQHVWYTEE